MLDAIHKGYSFTEIVWDTSMGQWMPNRLEWRDPRWFDFDRQSLSLPQLIQQTGEREPLPGGKFIFNVMKAKSGLALRGGLARNTAWAWMFKAYSNRDWAIFTQAFGQPIRVGKYGPGASPADREALFRAIANVAGDMAAMIPESMKIEFVENGTIGASADLYKERVSFLDQQVSKAILGQTATTDAIAGGHAVGQEHRLVQEDIERADAKQTSAVVNRDLVRVWTDLNYGPQEYYPRVRIGRPEVKDVKLIAGVARDLRLPLKASEAYDLVGFSKPEPGDEVIIAGGGSPSQQDGEPPPVKPAKPVVKPPAADPKDEKTLHLGVDSDPGVAEGERIAEAVTELGRDGAVLGSAGEELLLTLLSNMVMDPTVRDLEDLRTRLLTAAPSLSTRAIALAMRQAIVVAELSGRADLVDG